MYVLFIYLATVSISGGMATTSQQFATLEACKAAAKNVHSEFGGIATRVFTFCVDKDGIKR